MDPTQPPYCNLLKITDLQYGDPKIFTEMKSSRAANSLNLLQLNHKQQVWPCQALANFSKCQHITNKIFALITPSIWSQQFPWVTGSQIPVKTLAVTVAKAEILLLSTNPWLNNIPLAFTSQWVSSQDSLYHQSDQFRGWHLLDCRTAKMYLMPAGYRKPTKQVDLFKG